MGPRPALVRAALLQHRLDALKRKCTTGYSCGSSCISLRKECRTSPRSAIGKERLKRLLALAGGAPSSQRGIGTVRAAQATALAGQLEQRRGKKAQKLRSGSKAKESLSGITITTDSDGGEPRLNGLKPTRSLGSGAFGKTYQFDTEDGPVVVKVNGLTMGDPAESNPGVGLAEQRENVARREFTNLQRAHETGLGPEPIGNLTHLPDGRWSLAYRMLPGSKLTPSHNTVELTSEAATYLADPKAAARYVAGALQLARRQADTGLIHGDLHGGNVLVAPDGTPRLIDWGQVRESSNPWNQGSRSPAMKASDEGYALIPLLSMAGQAQLLPEAAKGVSELVAMAREKARDAEIAFGRVIAAYDLDWEEANEEKVVAKLEKGEFRRRIVEANRLKQEEGMPFDMALRDPRVGLEPPLTPEVLARAAKARDAIFGQSDLDEMRRELDRRFGGRA
jgi:hypothetical protein